MRPLSNFIMTLFEWVFQDKAFKTMTVLNNFLIVKTKHNQSSILNGWLNLGLPYMWSLINRANYFKFIMQWLIEIY